MNFIEYICIYSIYVYLHRGFPGSSADKESTYNAADPSVTPGSGKYPGEGNGNTLQYSWAFPGGSDGEESACNAGDPGLIPGLGRSPGEGNGYPLQYSCLENLMHRGAWWATVHRLQRVGHH